MGTVDNFDHETINVRGEFAGYLEKLSSDVDRMWEGQSLNHLLMPIDIAGPKIDSVGQNIDTVRREMNGLAAAFSEALYKNRSLGARLGSGLSLLYRCILPARLRKPLSG